MTPVPGQFTHLHVHSQFSLLRATPSVEALAARAAADGLARLALTDSNALYGMIAFVRACRAQGIAPIAGMTLPVATSADAPAPEPLVLLARTAEGYRSLCRLSSLVQADPERETLVRHGVPWEALAAHAGGLFCLCGGRRSGLEQAVRQGRPAQAAALLARLAGLFDDACRLSLEVHTAADVPAARELQALGQRFGVAAVAVQPVYCQEPTERPLLRVLAAIERNCRLEKIAPDDWPGGDAGAGLHWLTPAAMAERFAAFPAALAEAGAVAAACEPLELDRTPKWPVLALPPGVTADSALREQAARGRVRQFGDDGAAQERLDAELDAIATRGFAPFFLIVADIVAFARRHDIPVSTRGSVANSLVAYCMAITSVDPLANDLLFERFLNPARSGLPDIDLDFCSRRRDEVLAYVRSRYGEQHVALVATVSTLRPRSAVRETGKALGLDNDAIDRLVKLLPDAWHPDPRRRVQSDAAAVVAQLADEREREAVRLAYALVGQPDHLSVHPGGVVITPGPLTDTVPVQLAPKGFLITQFDHGDVEEIGLPKLDLLGIRALTVLADAAEMVRQHDAPAFRLDAIPLDDAATGDLLARGETVGVFQCESTGAQRTLRQLNAHSVRDLAVANAFFKPGPATGGMAAHFVRRYRGEERTTYLHQALEPILRHTSGVLLFQEQILRVAREVAGLSWAEADHLRRGMSRFRSDEMDAMRERFVAGCCRPAPGGPGFAPAQAQTLWEQVKAFAGYGFNQGHATAYADVSYRSAFLKAHWPAAFLCARLADWGGYYHQAVYIAEARRLGIVVRPPHVNYSGEHFTLDYEQTPAGRQPVLWMGLGQVRDLRAGTIASLLTARRVRPFRDVGDLTQRVGLQGKELTHLVRCGALDGLGGSRTAQLVTAAQDAHGAGQMSFDFVMTETPPESAAQRLAWEEQVLGIPISVHPLAVVNVPTGATQLASVAGSLREQRVAGVRLPGWTGGQGFFLADEHTFVVAVGPREQRSPPAWQPVALTGRWVRDDWGGGALHYTILERL